MDKKEYFESWFNGLEEHKQIEYWNDISWDEDRIIPMQDLDEVTNDMSTIEIITTFGEIDVTADYLRLHGSCYCDMSDCANDVVSLVDIDVLYNNLEGSIYEEDFDEWWQEELKFEEEE